MSEAREALCAFLGASLLIAALAGIGGHVPWIKANLTVVVAGVFLYLPAWLLARRGQDSAAHGLTLRPLGRNAAVLALVCAAVFPPYAAGFHVWQTELFGGRYAPSPGAYHRFVPQGGPSAADLFAAATLEGRPEGAPAPDTARVFADGDRLLLEWGPLSGRHAWSVAAAGPPAPGASQTGRMGVAAGWAPLRVPPEVRDIELHITPPLPLLVGGPATPTPAPGRLAATRSASWIVWLVLTQLLLVAVPEEFFYRAYVQGALARSARLAPFARRLFGAQTNPAALAATSALFALGHFIVGLDPQRLAVFFPSLLFGWMKDATGSIAAAAAFHAACNILVDLLGKAYVFG